MAPTPFQERWQQLQQLRRGSLPAAPLLEALCNGDLAPEPDLLAALASQLDQPGVQQLLSGPLAEAPLPLLEALRQELPGLAQDPERQQAWLEPLLEAEQRAGAAHRLAWLELLGHFRDPRVAARLRAALQAATPEQAPLLPLLGQQRQPQDGALLLDLATRPGALLLRQAALEGLAVGLSAWPVAALAAGLSQLATDLNPALAAKAVDLLARLPDGAAQLRQLQRRALEPTVAARLRRRLPLSPLVLVVHGRPGGVIPQALQELAEELQQRRGAPVLLQALTAAPPVPSPAFERAAQRSGAATLVPLLLLPGSHVRTDLPALAAAWRPLVPQLWRQPFLGAWPDWQRLLAGQLRQTGAGAGLCWLHHPLEGPLAQRFLTHLAQVLGQTGQAAAYNLAGEDLARQLQGAAVVAPLTLAANRLSETLASAPFHPPVQVLPPLLDLPAVRLFLLDRLEALP